MKTNLFNAALSEALARSVPPARVAGENEPRFPEVACSQCGHSFGPGDSGFSSCIEHQPTFRCMSTLGGAVVDIIYKPGPGNSIDIWAVVINGTRVAAQEDFFTALTFAQWEHDALQDHLHGVR